MFFQLTKKMHSFLEMQYNIITDTVCIKALLLRSKIKVNMHILFRNLLEFETFINSAGLSQAQAATITASLSNRNYTHNAIFAMWPSLPCVLSTKCYTIPCIGPPK